MNREMTRARIRLIGNMNNYELQRVMLKEIEETLKDEARCLFLEVKQSILEDRFHHLDQAFDRMKEENVGNTYRAAMRSIAEEIRKVQDERFQVLKERAQGEMGLKKITVLGNMVRGYESRGKQEEAKRSMVQAIACIQELEGDKLQTGWQTLIDPLAGSTRWTEELLPFREEMKGKTLRELYVALISSAAKEEDAQQSFERTMEAVSVLKDQESSDVYFIFLWETLAFLKQLNLPKSMLKKLWIVILENADALNHVPAVAKMHVFLANYAMGDSNFTEAKAHLESLEGIVDAYGYELLFEEHAEMIKRAMADMKRDLPKAGKRSPLRLVEITPDEMKNFLFKKRVAIKEENMRSARIQQLSVIHLFGEPAFQLKRLQTLKAENFHEWQDLEKAVYYQTARKLIENEMEDFDRQADREGFRMLLRNRYQAFLAQSLIEPRPEYRLHALLQLSSIAEHEEGEGEGQKYMLEAKEWVAKVGVEDQEQIGDLLADALEASPKMMMGMFLKTIGTWKDSAMLPLAFKTLEVMAENEMVEGVDFRCTVEATVNYLRLSGQGEYVLRLTNHLVQVVKACQAKPETKAYFWKLAYDAAVETEEPYTRMLMAVLLGNHMMEEKNEIALRKYLAAIDEVTAIYGEETTFGSNYQQITEALVKMNQALLKEGKEGSGKES